jgi:hypothetical protein
MDMQKTERPCQKCHKKFMAVSGDICAECWPQFQKDSPEWQEFFKQFPWVLQRMRGE